MSNQIQSNQHSITDDGNPSDGSVPEAVIAPAVRQRIVREAMRLFAAKGYNGVSVREIVEAAGITKPTLYYYYPSKEILFQRVVVDTLEEFRKQLEEAIGQPGAIRERLLRICRLHFEFSKANAEHFQLVHNLFFSNEAHLVHFDFEAFFKHNFELICGVLADGIASGEIREGNPWLMTLVLVGAVHMFLMALHRDPSLVPSEGLAEVVVDMCLKGLEKQR